MVIFLLLLSVQINASQTCLDLALTCPTGHTDDDKDVLIKIFLSSQGVGGWDRCDNWCTEQDALYWNWVSYGNIKGFSLWGEGGRELELSHNNLEGNIVSFQGISRLGINGGVIDLSHNKIAGLPSDFSSNPETVEKLDLSHNQLTSLPSSITNISFITGGTVDVRGNKLCSVPTDIQTWLDANSITSNWRLAQTCTPKTRVIFKTGQTACRTGDIYYEGNTIQSVLDLSSNGDNIIICEGTYQESVHIPDHLTQNLLIEGITNSDEWLTILDGGGSGTILAMNGDEDGSVIIENIQFKNANKAIESNSGFTLSSCFIQNIQGNLGEVAVNDHMGDVFSSYFYNNKNDGKGIALSLKDPGYDHEIILDNCIFEKNENMDYNGAGIYIKSANVSITNTLFSGNISPNGGAVFAQGVIGNLRNIEFTDCIFINNEAHGDYGGALYLSNAYDNKINGCNFVGNEARARGGAIYLGDSRNTSTKLTIDDETYFIENVAGDCGGAIFANDHSYYSIDHSHFYRNESDNGAAIYHIPTTTTMVQFIQYSIFRGNVSELGNIIDVQSGFSHSLFYDNVPGENMSIANMECAPACNTLWLVIDNSTIYNNPVPEGTEHYNQISGTGELRSTIVWDDDETGNVFSIDPTSYITYSNCILKGDYPGNGTINSDPLVIKGSPAKAGDLDFSLSALSPAIEAGAMYDYYTVDLAGNPRLKDGDGDGSEDVDIGAYEFQSIRDNVFTLINNIEGNLIFKKDPDVYNNTVIVKKGETIKLPIKYDSESEVLVSTIEGENLDNVQVDGVDRGPLTKVTVSTNSSDHTVIAFSSAEYHSVTIDIKPAPDDGVVEPEITQMRHGEPVFFYFTPKGGNYVTNVKITGHPSGREYVNKSVSKYFLERAFEDITIEATFTTCPSQTNSKNFIRVEDYSNTTGQKSVMDNVPDGFGNIVQSQTILDPNRVIASGFFTDGLNRIYKDVKPYVHDFGYDRGGDIEVINMHCDVLAKNAGEYYNGTGNKPNSDGDYAYVNTVYADAPSMDTVKLGNPGKPYSTAKNHHFNKWEFGIQKKNFIDKKNLSKEYLNKKEQGSQKDAKYFLEVEKNANGNYTQTIKNKFGEVLQRWSAPDENDVIVPKYSYDINGQVTKITQPLEHLKSTNVYDPLGNLIEREEPDEGTVAYKYDDKNRLVYKKNQRDVGLEVNGKPKCSNEIDDDDDKKTDLEDPDCSNKNDNSENKECSDDKDNDGDGLKDEDDPGCFGEDDTDENDEYFTMISYDDQNRIIATCETNGYGDFEDESVPVDCFDPNRKLIERNFYDKVSASELIALNKDFNPTVIELIVNNLLNSSGKLVASVSYNFDLASVVTFYSYNSNGEVYEKFQLSPEWGIGKVAFSYDINGNIIKEGAYKLNGTDWEYKYGQKYFYDNLQRLSKIEAKYSASDVWQQIIGVTNYDFGPIRTYSFFNKGDTIPFETVKYKYDIQGVLTNISTELSNPKSYVQTVDYTSSYIRNITKNIFEYNYDKQGSPANETHTLNYAYDNTSRLLNVNTASAGFESSYGYDLNGRFTKKDEGDEPDEDLSGFKYAKKSNRLEDVKPESVYPTNENFVYDPLGNLVLDKSKKMVIDYNPKGLPKEFCIYDIIPAQPLTWKDVKDQGLVDLGSVIKAQIKMHYDSEGTRVLKHLKIYKPPPNPPEIQKTAYFLNYIYTVEESGDIEESANIRNFSDVIGKVVLSDNNKEFFYLKDNIGSIRAVMDETGKVIRNYMYQSYGKEEPILGPSGDYKQKDKFSGKEFDEEAGIDIYYFGARYFDPIIGLWVSTDSARQFFSLYAYGMNPIKGTDPDGNYFITEEGYIMFDSRSSGITQYQGVVGSLQWDAYNEMYPILTGNPYMVPAMNMSMDYTWYNEGKEGSFHIPLSMSETIQPFGSWTDKHTEKSYIELGRRMIHVHGEDPRLSLMGPYDNFGRPYYKGDIYLVSKLGGIMFSTAPGGHVYGTNQALAKQAIDKVMMNIARNEELENIRRSGQVYMGRFNGRFFCR